MLQPKNTGGVSHSIERGSMVLYVFDPELDQVFSRVAQGDKLDCAPQVFVFRDRCMHFSTMWYEQLWLAHWVARQGGDSDVFHLFS